MHFEILVEDRSGKRALDVLIPKIIGAQDTFRVIGYRGIGRVPPNLRPKTNADQRILLDRLPKFLRGYGQTFVNYPANYPAVLFVVCDLDDNCLKTFRQELLAVLHTCNPRPNTRFCIAIEEGEAWLLGDVHAIKAAYPQAKDAVLNGYINDSICGTWEVLADAVFPGGSRALKGKGGQAVGREKSIWATRISPLMDVENNTSPSFQYFRGKLRALT